MNENKQNNPEIKKISDDVNKKTHQDVLKWIIIGLAGFIIIILIFGAGMFIGGMKAKFSYRWAESYHKNFAGPPGGFFGEWQKILYSPATLLRATVILEKLSK